MYSLAFPEIFKSNRTQLVKDKEAAASNLKLILGSVKKELFGDPDFGNNIKKYLYENSNMLLVDLVIDEIYSVIKTYVPQIQVNRKDITITTSKTAVLAEIVYKYMSDQETNMFSINLTEE